MMTSPSRLTGRALTDHRLLATIDAHWRTFGIGPQYGDLTHVTGTGTSGVIYHLERLRREGFVTWEPYTPYTLRVVQP